VGRKVRGGFPNRRWAVSYDPVHQAKDRSNAPGNTVWSGRDVARIKVSNHDDRHDFDKLYGAVQSVGRLTTPARGNFAGPQSAPAENVPSRQTAAEQHGLGDPDILFSRSR
jgi:hypothetical protein